MAEMSNYLEDEILDHILGQGSLAFSPGTLWVALCTSTPSDTSTGATIAEVADSNGYARQAISFNAASGGSATNNGDISFTASGGNWGTVTSFVVVDSSTHGAGNVYFWTDLDASQVVNDGSTLTFDDGTGITVSIN